MKKILIKNIGSLITVSSNSELKKGGKMKELPSINNAWLKIKDNRILDFGGMDNWEGIDDWNEFNIIDACFYNFFIWKVTLHPVIRNTNFIN